MRLRWLGVAGAALLVTSLALMVVGPRLWPTAFFGVRAAPGAMMGGQGSMMGGGQGSTMGGGMMGIMMADHATMQSMMSGEVGGDPAQPFDLRFLDQMVPHHQMAVHSAQAMIATSERPELRDLARRIIIAQQAEIEQMGQWRSAWFPEAPAAPTMTMMSDRQGSMMGDQAQMDRLFLEMMIPHHEAAISMAHQALDESQRPEIRALADAIISSQTAEISEMQGYLRNFFGVATP